MITPRAQISGYSGNRPVPHPAAGVMLCVAVTLAAYSVELAQHMIFGKVWLDALVLAILLGTAIRTCWTPGEQWRSGIAFSSKYPLEIAVVMLGASISTATISAAGPVLLLGISVVVAVTLLFGFLICRWVGLSPRISVLIACGNAICGNSAIAAIAAVIDADPDEVAVSIAFPALLSIGVVLALPIAGLAWHGREVTYGAFAGLLVYAVPQVISAASALGPVAIQMATLVKLVRVLMLGPICVLLSLYAHRIFYPEKCSSGASGVTAQDGSAKTTGRLVPWFIIGFLVLAGLRSAAIIPMSAAASLGIVATWLTVMSMAALGLGVDIRTASAAGPRIIAATVLSLITLAGLSLALLWLIKL